jgi:pilus assembly protein Flp/PilA
MQFLKNEEGQGLTEYSLILVVVAILLIVLLAILGTQIASSYQYIIDQLSLI